MGKGENSGYQHFLLFSQCFQKPSFSRSLKVGIQEFKHLKATILTHFHTMLHFDAVDYIAVENIVRKGEIACNMQFLLFSQCFLPYLALIFHYSPFPNKPWFLCVCSTSLLKTLWKKLKSLVMTNFTFSQSVFYPSCRTVCHFHQI